jgi:phage baseplate assembly protein W
MHPRFGTRLRESLFEPNYPTLVAFIDKEISEAIKFWMPFIEVFDLDVSIPEHGANQTTFKDRMHGLSITLTFGLVNNRLDKRTIVLEIKAD